MAKPQKRRRERGSIRERNGVFQVRVYAGIDPLTGRELYLSETAYTREEAERARTRLLNKVDENRHPKSRATVGFILDRWLEVADLEDSTREDYEDKIRVHIRPVFGDMPAGKLDAEMLERFYAQLRRCRDRCDGRRKGKPGPDGKPHECRPLAANTVRKIHYILRAALARAVRWKYISVNEAELAEPPAFDRKEPDPPSASELAAVLTDASRAPEWFLLLWLTAILGARRGEVCGLRWTHVDFQRGIISLERSYVRGKEKDTKTGQKRRIALDAETLELLRLHREKCEERCRALGSELPADAFIFTRKPDGSEPLNPPSVTQRYRRLAERNKLRSTRLHSLRHYSATELIAAGVDLRTVAGRLGHGSGGATTLRIYAAWVNEADRRAADTIARIIPRPGTPARKLSPYEQIADGLRAAIEGGELRPGDLLPTVKDLADENGVSVGTAHRALAALAAEGLISVRRGSRAVVTAAERGWARPGRAWPSSCSWTSRRAARIATLARDDDARRAGTRLPTHRVGADPPDHRRGATGRQHPALRSRAEGRVRGRPGDGPQSPQAA